MSQAVLCDNYSLNGKSIYYNGEIFTFLPKEGCWTARAQKGTHIKANRGTTFKAIYL